MYKKDQEQTIKAILKNNGIDISALDFVRNGGIKSIEYKGKKLGIYFMATMTNHDYLMRRDETIAIEIIRKIKEM